MDNAKIPDLYAILGITNQHASQHEIQVAYDNLAIEYDPERYLGVVQPNVFEFIKIYDAYEVLSDPEKRAEYDQRRARVCHEVTNTPERTCNLGQRSRPEEKFPTARAQLQLRISKRAWVQRTPPRAQLRVQVQLRAHARRLAQIQQQTQLQGLPEADRQAEVESHDGFDKVLAVVSQMLEPFESVNEDSARQEEEKKKVLARQAAEEEAKLREQEVAREQAAAAQTRAREIEWINQEAKESILILAGMGGCPMRPPTTGYAQMLRNDYVRRLVERTDDLLDYLWDKAHSGDWICPEIKEAIDLDRLLGLVLQREAQGSYFPSATQDLAASLLRKWRGEDCDETAGSTPLAQESTSSDSESSDGDSSSEENEAEGESPNAALQCKYPANVSGEARTAKNPSPSVYPQAAEQQRSPFAQNTQQASPFARDAQQKSPFSF